MQYNFDNVTLTPKANGYNIIGWDSLKAQLESLEINNVGSNAYAKQSIITDDGHKVLKAQIIGDDPINGDSVTRAQLTMRFPEGLNLSNYHFSHRMKLNQDISYLNKYPESMNWFTLVEIWNKHIDTMDGDGAGSARWNLNLFKDKGIGKPLFWVLKSEYMQPEAKSYNHIWYKENRVIEIPYDKWFTLDINLIRGGSVSGKMIVIITIDGQQPITLFNVMGATRYPEQPEVQLKSWQPFKLYLDPKYLEFMQLNNKEVSAEYDQLTWNK